MEDPIQRIKSANDIKASKALEIQRHEDMKVALINVRETILKSFTSLVNYLDGKVTKTVIVNQLREIGTPDALKVIPFIESLHETLKTHKNTDLTELTKLMTEMLAEAKKIPKDHMRMPEMKMMDYSSQLKELSKAVKAVETVIKAQNLVVEAPVVNVDAPIVNIPPPDLKPLQGGLKDVVTAIKKIIIPEYKTDNKAVEALIKKSNELLKKLLEKPVSSGGGGSGRVSPYSDSNGMPSFVTLVDGKIPVDVDMVTEGIATSAKQLPDNHRVTVSNAGLPILPYPAGATPITASSGNVAAGAAVATLAGTSGKTTYITGFEITSSGSTVGLVVGPTVVGTISGTMTYVYAAIAGALLINTPLIVSFSVPIPASTTNTAIVVTLPSLGLGNTNACVVAHGYQL